MMRAVGLSWTVVAPLMQWFWSFQSLSFGHGSPEWPSRWSSEDKWVQGTVFLTLGYVIIRVQVEGVKGYKKEQVALVITDSTAFGSRIPVILGTTTINQIINIIKESEIDELSVSLNGSRISCLLAGCWVDLSLKNDENSNPICDLTDLDEAVKSMKWEEIAFSSKIVYGHTKTVLLGNNMFIMTQAPEQGEEPCLPHGISMVNTYTKMTTGSRRVAVEVKTKQLYQLLSARATRLPGC